MAEKQRYDVFLSYSSGDKPWVSEFASALREAGVKAWFDVFELAPGERWQDKSQEALRDSSTLIIILSPTSVDSPRTFFELGAAVADKKRIIPVVTEDVDLMRVASLLRQFQFLRESSPREAGRRVAEILEQVESKPEQTA
jgi:nucleoside 2-deoxyribosyltransferase